MITLHTWTTPNGRKISIMLEELGLPYEVNPVNIGKNQQFSAEFLSISPNNKIPAIVDHDAEGGPLAIFESGAILTYLAEKSGRFLAASGPERYSALEWLHWQIGGYGPMLGQLGFFGVRSTEKAPLAIQRFTDECERLLNVMETRLAASPYLAGSQYTIADIATYTWTVAAASFLKPILGESLANKPGIQRWMNDIGQRPAVQRGMLVPTLP
ncbi:glutathione S-transferase N-terminal domain-containing protein [Undibacterium sp.]|uniref:glutathione S-transferase N-terminal domain-containing protein n=1 Tax=Undibacterium sp. TaxID=1914977 RepID=UPI00374DDF93